ncbi:D-lactaldehyde dehydrogenase [Dacryopinax primogenitus]|uniref:D-lactaldehyde dehydrogenase n=1 Tax=Dacryopinax primogenitus (strain DJM 731) TaxID=1858805 RepID=M5FUX0_DACPD|nr:D-lactaldehyde dehydrogenase [Dacryopinax primogenitus]EJU00054.1 D-lactaldehyde dehydrogenase [Dacryopinax primogenitus]
MTVVSAPAKVLLTGVNGFIAVWILQDLLEQGYSVRGTVRSAPKGEFLKHKYAKYGDKLEIVVVDDITASGAFDESVKGVDAILHTAAPVTFSGDYDSVIKPAVESTKSILNSALAHGSSIKRVILTSSVVTLLEPHDPGYTYSDKDWNEYAVNEVKTKGDKAPGYLVYFAAKTLAEQEAWKWYGQHKREIRWDMATILPPYVFGPLVHEVNGKPRSFLYMNLQQEKPRSELGAHAGAWIDVRNVALAHVRSLQVPEAAEERLIISAGGFSWQDVYDAVASVKPEIEGIPRGVPGIERAVISQPHPSKATKLLGIEYVALAESARDTILSVRDLSA